MIAIDGNELVLGGVRLALPAGAAAEATAAGVKVAGFDRGGRKKGLVLPHDTGAQDARTFLVLLERSLSTEKK